MLDNLDRNNSFLHYIDDFNRRGNVTLIKLGIQIFFSKKNTQEQQ